MTATYYEETAAGTAAFKALLEDLNLKHFKGPMVIPPQKDLELEMLEGLRNAFIQDRTRRQNGRYSNSATEPA